METNKNIVQNIFNSQGELAQHNVFSIESLNSKIIATSILKNNKQKRWNESPSSNLDVNDLIFKYNNKTINEEWIPYNLEPSSKRRGKYKKIESLTVSNLGRIKINNVIAIQKDKQGLTGYLIIENYPAFGMVWNLVANTWLEKPQGEGVFQVHHITNNGYDNSVWNLIWLDKGTHAKINHQTRN